MLVDILQIFFPTLLKCFLYLYTQWTNKKHQSAIISIKKKYSLRYQEKLTEIGAILKDPGGKVHSFLKQCLHDICLTQKRGTFTKPFNLTTTVLKMNGLFLTPLSFNTLNMTNPTIECPVKMEYGWKGIRANRL